MLEETRGQGGKRGGAHLETCDARGGGGYSFSDTVNGNGNLYQE